MHATRVPVTYGSVAVRPYTDKDALPTLSAFLGAVTVTASADYAPEQIAAWAGPPEPDIQEWNLVRIRRGTIVALVDQRVAGFSDVDDEGFIDMMFVAPAFGRQGVGSAHLFEVERRARIANTTRLATNVSITARPFFARHGFDVLTENHPITRGVQMTNFHMTKHLC